jgi:hypothetical protein
METDQQAALAQVQILGKDILRDENLLHSGSVSAPA